MTSNSNQSKHLSLEAARNYCAAKHAAINQKYNQHDYSYHLNKVEGVAVRFGFTSDEDRIACQGHDLVEDTGTTLEELAETGFPEQSILMIDGVTDVEGATRSERKKATYPKTRKLPRAVLLKLWDRIANVEACMEMKNKEKFDKYAQEHIGFEQALRNRSNAEEEPMWLHLEKLFATNL
ncbi:MAG: HD domain-containing protein [Cyanobacteria bacterium]|nr:HD domain-containing protein [Cyanobacteriota bacterium]